MKAFVFKPSNALRGKFDVGSINAVEDGFLEYAAKNEVEAWDYIECAGSTWTVQGDGTQLALAEGRLFPEGMSQKSASSPASGGSVENRYQDAYLTSRAIDGFGSIIKVLAVLFGLVVVFGGFYLSTEARNGAWIFGGLILGVAFGVPIYVLGVLVAAQGQILKATLDTAVNSSPFLTEDQRASVMSIKR